ncbi:MAG: hypothetical protein FVQ79_06270 [Planctomycetes bacterium]|nr:hypothetical protein [Planctomycetota bacterium]
MQLQQKVVVGGGGLTREGIVNLVLPSGIAGGGGGVMLLSDYPSPSRLRDGYELELAMGGWVQRPPSLDPRLEGGNRSSGGGGGRGDMLSYFQDRVSVSGGGGGIGSGGMVTNWFLRVGTGTSTGGSGGGDVHNLRIMLGNGDHNGQVSITVSRASGGGVGGSARFREYTPAGLLTGLVRLDE